MRSWMIDNIDRLKPYDDIIRDIKKREFKEYKK